MEPETSAEKRVLEAASRSDSCDLRTPQERANGRWRPTVKQAESWDKSRSVRAEFIHFLLFTKKYSVHIYGAKIVGVLKFRGEQRVPLNLIACVITGHVDGKNSRLSGDASFERTTFVAGAAFSGAEFPGATKFTGATFYSSAGFDRAAFNEVVDFQQTTYRAGVSFSESRFALKPRFKGSRFTEHFNCAETIFQRGANFTACQFLKEAHFEKSYFGNSSNFRGTLFRGVAQFDSSTFNGPVHFDRAAFAGPTTYQGATLISGASFRNATFEASASFRNTICAKEAFFGSARFYQEADFEGALFMKLDLSQTVWECGLSSNSIVAAGASVSLVDAEFKTSIRINMDAPSINATRMQAKESVHFTMSTQSQLTLEEADIAPGSRIAGAPDTDSINVRRSPRRLPIEYFKKRSGDYFDDVWRAYCQSMNSLYKSLSKMPGLGNRPEVTSLRRAQVSGVTISDLNLRRCEFSAASGLDSLVISGSDGLASNRGESRRSSFGSYEIDRHHGYTWWKTDRRIIYDEVLLGSEHSSQYHSTASKVSATYRTLRKSLEESKNSPGASDFYYGEMEMRRRAAAMPSAERLFLEAYRALSGYGLRAWRAVLALAMVVTLAGWCFTNSAWVRPGATRSTATLDPDSAIWPWAFAAQETVAIFRPAGTAGVTLVGAGIAVDIFVKAAGPVLLALIVLAIRNRMKR